MSIGLFLCIFHMPYWYYQIIRLSATAGFCYLAYLSYKNNEKVTPFLYAFSAILLNPFVKIYFKKQTWNIIDVILAVFLITTLFSERKLKANDNKH